jgi:hypothetical protein
MGLNALSYLEWSTLLASLALLLAAKPICDWLNKDNVNVRASMMRVLNVLIVIAILLNNFIWSDNVWITRITQSLIIVYFAFVGIQIINYLIRLRFGKRRVTSDQRTVISDTYSSRGLSLFSGMVIAIVALVACLNVLGFKSLLETGGALGIIGLFLAMTQASWAPDLISGLIILNSRVCEEGEVIQFNLDGKPVVASVFKTKTFHTECLDLANNHRIMIRNAKLRDFGIHNLSRFASARGLRECLLFNIGYEHKEHQVSAMFDRAFEALDTAEVAREEQHEHEVRVYETGDYAVTWAVYYYIKDVKKVLAIRQLIRSYILEESIKSNISLATPDLQIVNLLSNH